MLIYWRADLKVNPSGIFFIFFIRPGYFFSQIRVRRIKEAV